MSEQTVAIGDVVLHDYMGCVAEVLGTAQTETGQPAYRVDLGMMQDVWPAEAVSPYGCRLEAAKVRAFLDYLGQSDVTIGGDIFFDPVTGISDAVGLMLRFDFVSPYRVIDKDYDINRALLWHYGLRPTQVARLCEINDQASDDERKAAVTAYLEELLVASGGAA